MNIVYRDYEYPTILLPENGYFEEMFDNDTSLFDMYSFNNEISCIDNIKYIKPENTICYFHEANILSKINQNEDNYFDFDKSIVDIGAHVGCYSFRSSFKYIYAFEPNEKVYHLLCVNLMIHNRYDISKVYNVMLSDKKEKIEFDGFHAKLNDQNTEHFDDLHNDLTRCVEFRNSHTLDEYNCENVGLIKIDVEGMEEKVLRGGLGTIIRNNYPPILFELWEVGFYGMTQEKRDSMKTFLEDLGYEILWNWGDSMTHLAIHKI